MSNHRCTDEQIERLKDNPHVKNVSDKAITYEEEFKELFISEYTAGKLPSQIFKDAGFDTEVLGSDRIKSFSSRIKKQFDRAEGFEDQRKYSSGRPRVNGLTPEEKIEQLEAKNEILQQESCEIMPSGSTQTQKCSREPKPTRQGLSQHKICSSAR